MKKKVIADIRLYKDGSQFAEKSLNAMVKRIVMKLREKKFSLGEFDHLYLNFVVADREEKMFLSEEADRYHPWYRYCFIPVEREFYDRLHAPESKDKIVQWLKTALITYFSTEGFDEAEILACIRQAMAQGEEMRMKFKEKVTGKRRAVVFLRYLDTCRYSPLLQVYDTEDHLLFSQDLPETISLDYLGEIQVSGKRVTMKPRKNALTTQMAPMVFTYNPVCNTEEA
jgi:hypothetical protein